MSERPKSRNQERPFVFINMALSADGKIATANRAVHSFGSPQDLEHLYELRATADAILCGARTIEISQATLGNGREKFRRWRLKHGLAEFPLRILVSGSGSIDPAAEIFKTRFSPILLLTTQRAAKSRLIHLRDQVDEMIISKNDEIDFPAVLRSLRSKWGVKRLLCEGGGEVNDALFRLNLVDEIHLTFCPKIFGGRSAPTLADGIGFPRLANASAFKLASLSRQKAELFTVFSRR